MDASERSGLTGGEGTRYRTEIFTSLSSVVQFTLLLLYELVTLKKKS